MKQTYLMAQSPMNALVVANAIGQLKAINIDGETMQFILDEVGMTDQMRAQLNAPKQSTWFEVFETDADGSTRTIASFDTKAEALVFIHEKDKPLGLDEWTKGENGIPQIVYNQIY